MVTTSGRFLNDQDFKRTVRKLKHQKMGKLGPVKYNVLLPELIKEEEGSRLRVNGLQKIYIKNQFRMLEKSDILYVYNPVVPESLDGYIGGNTILMMGKAFDCGIPIALKNHPYALSGNSDENIPYRHCLEEIALLRPITIGEYFDVIDEIINIPVHDISVSENRYLDGLLNKIFKF